MAATSRPAPLRRKHSRYELTAPVEVTVLRSGIPQSLPGRLVDASLGGVSVVLPGELFPGESVGVEFRLADAPAMVQARADKPLMRTGSDHGEMTRGAQP